MPGFRRVVTCEPPPAPLADGLTSLSACEESVGQAGCHPAGPLQRLALLLTHRGRAASWADGVGVQHRPGRLVALKAGTIYEERLRPGAWWHLSYLLLRGPWCGPLEQALARRPGGVLVIDDAPAALRGQLAATVQGLLTQPPGWAWSSLASLAGLMAGLLGCVDQADSALSVRVARLLDLEPAHPWSITALALRLHLAPATFVRRFASEAGCPPAAWVRRHRIARARQLLEQNLEVADVAERLGFANPYHFSRVFKAIAGIPPSRVRTAAGVRPLHGLEVATSASPAKHRQRGREERPTSARSATDA